MKFINKKFGTDVFLLGGNGYYSYDLYFSEKITAIVENKNRSKNYINIKLLVRKNIISIYNENEIRTFICIYDDIYDHDIGFELNLYKKELKNYII